MSVWRAQRQKETYTDLSRSLNKALKAISIIRIGAIDRYGWETLQTQLNEGQSIVERLIEISHDPLYEDDEIQLLYDGVKDSWGESDTTIRYRLQEINQQISQLEEATNPSEALSDSELADLNNRIATIRDVANSAVEDKRESLRGNFA